MLHLLRKQIIIFSLTVISSLTSFGQREWNRPNSEDRQYYFGMSLSYVMSYLHPTKHETFIQNDSILSVDPGSSGGIGLGLHATAKLNHRFEVRFNPTLIIGGSKTFTYSVKYPLPGESGTEVKKLPSTIVSLPFQIKFNSDRIDNFRVYLLGGFKYDIDLASNAAARNAENLIKLKGSDLGVELGVGFNFYLRYVTLSPEIKFGSGLTNAHSRDASLKFSNILDKLQNRMISFTLIIED